jgi:hypothetical protein
MKNKVVHKYDGNMTTLTFPRTLREACPNDKHPWLDDGEDKIPMGLVWDCLMVVVGWGLIVLLLIWGKL